MVVKVPDTLAALLGVERADIDVRREDRSGADFVISAVGMTFVVEVKVTTSAAAVAMAVRQVLRHAARIRRRAVPLLAVPFMGEVGRRVCEEAGVGWLDLSGNARIIAPGIRVVVEGKPNRFRAAGRPPNLFAPKSSRITRWLLVHAGEPLTQREISRATGLDEGMVSRLVARLIAEDYLVRNEDGGVRVKDPALLLDVWREAYQFSKHTLHQGHVASRSGDALLRFVGEALRDQGIEHAATGLAAAWALTRFAAFRIATVYLPADPSPVLLECLGFREDPRGANLWLVVPNDEGVFQGAVEKDGIRCVHPVQVYVDLKDHPERAPEAAERLRTELLTWRRDG
ncbi:MAG: helix-turn-helix domain-containing protein [Deltaproteobacteria bacterium]|nr:helix-turn-helix domain-containing protein [Deltaproteobacteria bacterium]